MKEKIKKIPFMVDIWNHYKYLRDNKEFSYDKKFFSKYYIKNVNSKEKIEYSLLLSIHQIEKGFLAQNKRRFGKDKIDNIIFLLKKYLKEFGEKGFIVNLTLSCLDEYAKLYEQFGWIDSEEYIRPVRKAIKNYLGYKYHT